MNAAAIALAPFYALWIVGGRLADLRGQRRRALNWLDLFGEESAIVFANRDPGVHF